MKKIIIYVILLIIQLNSFTYASEQGNYCKEKTIENAYSPIFSPDWKSFAFGAEKDWKVLIVKDWIEGNKYEFISDLNYSLDSNSFVYLTKNDWKDILVKIKCSSNNSNSNITLSSNEKNKLDLLIKKEKLNAKQKWSLINEKKYLLILKIKYKNSLIIEKDKKNKLKLQYFIDNILK